MSKKRIKNPDTVKVIKPKGESKFDVRKMALEQRKLTRHTKETIIVEDLIADEKLDTEKIDDYKHIQSVAKEIGWSTSKLSQAIEVAGIKEMIKNELESKNKIKES